MNCVCELFELQIYTNFEYHDMELHRAYRLMLIVKKMFKILWFDTNPMRERERVFNQPGNFMILTTFSVNDIFREVRVQHGKVQ